MNIDQKEIMKTAASQLRGLSSEVQQFRENEEKRDLVEGILKKTASAPTVKEFLEKRAEYMDKDLEELKIIDKAVELQKTGELQLGSLSAQSADNGSMDALTAFLVDDYLQ